MQYEATLCSILILHWHIFLLRDQGTPQIFNDYNRIYLRENRKKKVRQGEDGSLQANEEEQETEEGEEYDRVRLHSVFNGDVENEPL